jgi:GNAT superfamily N-acetyltransferase
MINIDKRSAIEFLKRDIYRNLLELHALEQNIHPIMDRFFADAEAPSVVMLVAESWAILSGYHEVFLPECFDWLRNAFDKFTLLSVDKRVFDRPMIERHQLQFGKVGRRRSFVCTSMAQIPAITVDGCRLTESDKDAVERYPEKSSKSNPGLSQFFEWFVLDGRGEVFAIKENDEIVAYLSCGAAYENIWDVFFVHVREDRRKQGLGTQVTALYAREMLMQNKIPYYSSAVNEASERTALKAGFVCCREMFSAEVSSHI